MGKVSLGPNCIYPNCQFDPHANPSCAKVWKAFGTCTGPCQAPCYVISAYYAPYLAEDSQDLTPN